MNLNIGGYNMSFLNILHLSDLHISDREKPEQESLREQLITDLKEICNNNKRKSCKHS